MPQTNEISKATAESAPQEGFTAYLRRKADEYDRDAQKFEDSEFYPATWWRDAAAGSRHLADEIDAIHGGRQ